MIEYNSPIGKIRSTEFVCSDTYYDVAERLRVPFTTQPIVCVKNGQPILRKDWDKPLGLSGDAIRFVQVPRGQSIKNILKSVALIALSVVAPYVGATLFGLTAGTLGASLFNAAFVIGGAFLINAVMGNAGLPKQQTSQSASPTYSLTAQGNSARLLQPIPRLYGTHQIFPDFAAQPYQSYENNEQYLYELFCLGVGEYQVDKINIAKTELWNSTTGISPTFSDIQLEIIPPGQTITLFPADVVTSTEVNGLELRYEVFSKSGTFAGNRVTFSGTVANIEFLAPGDKMTIAGSINAGDFTITNVDIASKRWIEFGTTFASGTATNSYTLDNWIGPYVANPNNQGTNQIKVDIILPRGLYYANDSGGLSNASVSYEVQAQPINNFGVATGPYVSLTGETFTLKTVTPQRYTRSFDLSLGRYQVRLRRLNQKQHDSRYGDEIQWQALRAFIPDDNTFADVTLLAVKIRATNQLSSQSSTQINVIESGKIPVWNGSVWSAPQVTQNPAWVAADILRNSVYGAGMADSRIDLAKLLTLSATWAARGDKFNAVFDTSQTLWDALAQVLTSVRSQPILVAGMVTFVRDEPKSLARTVITPQSILKNTFEMQHVLKGTDSADDVIVQYMDENTWVQTEVTCTLPGSTSQNPARIQIFGVTNISQAWREGMYHAASNSYRRILATVSTEADGRLLLKGDPVLVSHDVPQWAQSGFVMDYLETEKVLVFDRNVSFDSSGTNFITLRRRDGKEFGPIVVTSNGYSNEAVLEAGSLDAIEIAQGITIDQVLVLDSGAKETTFVFGILSKFAKRFLVTTSTMRGMTQVDLALAVDDSRVYTADQGTPPTGVSYLGPPVTPNGPVVSNIFVTQDPTSGPDPVTLNISWSVTAGATSYILQYSPNGSSWSTVYSGTATLFTALVNAGDVYLRVAAVGTILGPWVYISPDPQSFGTPSLTPGLISNLVITADVSAGIIEADFTAAPRATLYQADVLIESSVGSGIFDTLKLSKTSSATSISWNSTEITAVGGPWSRIQVNVYAINTSGTSVAVSQTATGISLGTVANLTVNAVYHGVEASLQWDPVTSATLYRIKVYNPSSVLVRETTTSSTSYFYSNSQLTTDGGPWRSFTVKVNAETSALVGAQATLNITDTAPAAPATISATSPSAGQAVISWSAVAGSDITGYIVYGSVTNGFTPGSGNIIYTGNALTFTKTGLTSGSTYYYRVATTDSYAGGDGYIPSAQFSRVIT